MSCHVDQIPAHQGSARFEGALQELEVLQQLLLKLESGAGSASTVSSEPDRQVILADRQHQGRGPEKRRDDPRYR